MMSTRKTEIHSRLSWQRHCKSENETLSNTSVKIHLSYDYCETACNLVTEETLKLLLFRTVITFLALADAVFHS